MTLLRAKILICICVALVPLKSVEALRFAYIDVPPYAFQTTDGQASGMLIEQVRQISSAIGEPITFVYLPHRRLIPFIESGEVDFWAGQKQSNVEESLSLVSDSPVFMMDMQAFWLSGNTPVESVEALKGKPLILISSYGYQGYLADLVDASDDVIFVTSHEDGVDALYDNPDHYLLGYKKIGQAVLERFDIRNVTSSSLLKTPLYLKLSSRLDNANAIMKAINQHMANGTQSNLN